VEPDGKEIKALLIYTMTSGLGDYLVLGNLMEKVESVAPGSRCMIIHRENRHAALWPGGNIESRFFNVFSTRELYRFFREVSILRKQGYTVFGLQMAPGSIQGFGLYCLLKKLHVVDYVVDFNLINADIITPPKGNYILELHLNQVRDLLGVNISPALHELKLPIALTLQEKKKHSASTIGLHPWSRRGHIRSFVWPFEKWLEVIQFMLFEYRECCLVVFGRDRGFEKFRRYIDENLSDDDKKRVSFNYSNSVCELINTINQFDALLTVNTAVVHIGYALKKRMFILNGPSLDLWVPKGENIHVIRDRKALFQASDKWEENGSFGSIDRIDASDVIRLLSTELAKGR